jgi:hypothetical protein
MAYTPFGWMNYMNQGIPSTGPLNLGGYNDVGYGTGGPFSSPMPPLPQPAWGNNPPRPIMPPSVRPGPIFPGIPRLQGLPMAAGGAQYSLPSNPSSPSQGSLFGPGSGQWGSSAAPQGTESGEPPPGDYYPPDLGGPTGLGNVPSTPPVNYRNAYSYNPYNYAQLPQWTSPLGTNFTNSGGQWFNPAGFPRATAVNPSEDPYGMSGIPGPVTPQPTPADFAGPGMSSILGLLGINARNI